MKPITRLGGIVVLIDLPTKDNCVIGEIDNEKLIEELNQYPIIDWIEIDDTNITGTMTITMKLGDDKLIPRYISTIQLLAEKHYNPTRPND